MRVLKDSEERCLVYLDEVNQHVIKEFKGHKSQTRFQNEVDILKFLNEKNCDFVPQLIESDKKSLKIVTTYTGETLEEIDEFKHADIHNRLESLGVTHNDSPANSDSFHPNLLRHLRPVSVEKDEQGRFHVTYKSITEQLRIIKSPKNLTIKDDKLYIIDFEFAHLHSKEYDSNFLNYTSKTFV